ncbi:Phenylalanine--tRNA ligase alpha subunit [Eumeta japonica]|uniref:Phenylalanine--tRNA ligase alpha subunit n=1 Tax=Eumeta variegata TaxID=151549 RepID=A0A4C1TA39_EUMVA|nr:Phenylalanine--tRNA ligase alpha subunit [Eumeta japonica]
MSQGWIFVDKSVNPPVVRRKVDKIDDSVQHNLMNIANGKTDLTANLVADYKKRKLLQEVTTKSFILSKGSAFATSLTKLETDLTVDMLASGLWKDLKFKSYNFEALGAPLPRGHLHPLLKVRTEFRQIF